MRLKRILGECVVIVICFWNYVVILEEERERESAKKGPLRDGSMEVGGSHLPRSRSPKVIQILILDMNRPIIVQVNSG